MTDPGTFRTDGPVVAALEHLTGRCRGQYSWLTAREAMAWLDGAGRLSVTAPTEERPNATPVARFLRADDGFEIEATGNCPIWVNRAPVTTAQLRHGDMIEFGETGPLSRIRLYSDAQRRNMTVSEIFGDTRSYIRSSRKPLARRIGHAIWDTMRRLAFETTVLFRGAVLLALGLLVIVAYLQYRSDREIRADIAGGNLQVHSLAAALAEARQEALRPGDLAALQQELRASVSATAERLRSLEAKSAASTRIITGASPAVVFIQGAYGLRDSASGRMLRHVLGEDGKPLNSPLGRPLLSLDGDGEIAEVQMSGSGFLLRDTRLLVTNRHVAQPWESKPATAGSSGLEPVMTRFIAYFPNRTDPVDLTPLAISDSADLALLSMDTVPEGVTGLPLAPDRPAPGAEVIVMGYPTGLRAMLAQAGEAFVTKLRKTGETGFWAVAAGLADAGLIAPLSSRGIVGRAGKGRIVYDAATTHGGSGGPVLNMAGEVVAVNTAIIPEYGGSNLGVPAARIRELVAQVSSGQ